MKRLLVCLLLMCAVALVGSTVAAQQQNRATTGSKARQSKRTGQSTKKKAKTSSSTRSKTKAASGSGTAKSGAQSKSSGTAAKEQTGAKTGSEATKAAENVEKPVNYGTLPIKKLFNGKDLSGWRLRHADGKNAWQVVNGVLANTERGTDLVSEEKFTDFELHLEVNVPQGGNSGVYLQGRYELQIADSAGATELTNSMMGAIYSKVAPRVNAAKPAGEWQTVDVHFMQAVRDKTGKIVLKPMVTVILNDEIVIDSAEIDGVTGGALDAEEGTPGPLMLQGDHTAVQYRNILIRPLPPRTVPEAEPEETPASTPPNGK